MKKWVIIAVFFANYIPSFSQTETEPAYKRFPTIPPLQILLTDSVTLFTEKQLKKNLPVFIFLFSPDCDHCQKETEELIDNIDKFQQIQVVMVTAMPFEKMKTFYDHNRLDRFSNIIVGYDKFYLLPTFYRIRNYPLLAYYNKDGNLIGVSEGGLPIQKVLEKFRE